MKIKKCPKCCIEKDITDFHTCKSRKISSYCKKCLYENQMIRWRDRKFKAVNIMGGKCSACGYNKCLDALEFHHIDPNNKEFMWNKLKSYTWKRVINELKKCIILCANCHREFHSKIYKNSNKDNSYLNNNGPIQSGTCPSCNDPTYGTKYCSTKCASFSSRKVKQRPSKVELENMIQHSSMTAIGKKYGISDNAVRKWAKSYNILL